MVYSGDKEMSRVQDWLHFDKPVLFPRAIKHSHANDEPIYMVELDADMAELVQRSEASWPEAALIDGLETLARYQVAAVGAGLWSVADRWCQWTEWAQRAKPPTGPFQDVLAVPQRALVFINAHRAFLMRLGHVAPTALLIAIRQPTVAIIQHYQKRVNEKRDLVEWAASSDLAPPALQVGKSVFGLPKFSSVDEIEQEVLEVADLLMALSRSAKGAFDQIPLKTRDRLNIAGAEGRDEFMRVFQPNLLQEWKMSSRRSSGSPDTPLTAQTAAKIVRIARGFPAIPTAVSVLDTCYICFLISCLAITTPAWLILGKFKLALAIGTATALLPAAICLIRMLTRPKPATASPQQVSLALQWVEAHPKTSN